MRNQGSVAPAGSLGLKVIRADGNEEDVSRPPLRLVKPDSMTWRALLALVRQGLPSSRVPLNVNLWRLKNLPNLMRGLRRIVAAKTIGVPSFFGALYLKVVRVDGTVEELGLASLRVVTTTGVGFIVDAFQNLTELENMKYHGLGTGTNAEASSDTALQTEITTEYTTDNTRPTGSLTEGATGNIFRTVGTIAVDASVAATEHGVLSQAATGGGTLLDRSKFSVVNLASGDSIVATYDLTLTAGG